ncbi:MAG: glycosyltransferase family 4 protein [Bacteroidetes bacterium]|nr:glycosyltransferase family 4 protein [Bacteroidota bacterium]
MNQKKIVMLVPGPNARGGITNYYYSIRKELPDEIIYVIRGPRNWPNKKNKLNEFGRFIKDNYNFIKVLIKEDVSVIQIALPFTSTAIIRDGLFILIGKLFAKKVVVFFRGWIDDYVYSLSGLRLIIIKKILFSANAIIELSESNKKHLQNLGYSKKIYLETTLVNKELIEDFDFNEGLQKRVNSSKKTILFLSRIEKEKGIYQLLDSFKIIKKQFPEFDLVYAGDGKEEVNLAKKIKDENITGVSLKGFVSGDEKKQIFKNANIFVFLSEHEGMPNAVLEAMAFGLPVITTNVGGIASVFKNEINGCLVNTVNPEDIAKNIGNIIFDTERYKEISEINYKVARNNFWSDVVAKRMVTILNEVSNTK